MADNKIQFPDPSASPFTDAYGQSWIWNDVAWVRRGLDPGVSEAPKDNQQYARVNPYDKANPQYPGTVPETGEPEDPTIKQYGYWELVQADEWYLGAHETPPNIDNFGGPLVEGHTYYDLPSHTMFVWDAVEWDAFSGVSEIATLWEYRWDSIGAQTAPYVLDALNNINGVGDDHGNLPFDQWVKGLIIIKIYKNEQRLVEKRTLTPAYEDMPGRPADEEDQVNFTSFSSLLTSAPVDTSVAYYITTDDDITVGASGNKSHKDFTYHYDNSTPGSGEQGSDYHRGGVELGHYDYIVDYDKQEITFLHDLVEGDTIVLETGTLAASQYIKTTYENATDWGFVSHACDMGGLNSSTGKLTSQYAVKCYVEEMLRTALVNTDPFIGVVFDFAGTEAPANSIECNNQLLAKVDYPKLFAAIGNTWNTFNNAELPSAYHFRAPPQNIDGAPVFYGGAGSYNVGDYLENTNKAHTHSATHRHTGSTSSTGNHRHSITGGSSAHDSSGYRRPVDGSPEYPTQIKYTDYTGQHAHSLTINDANLTTSANGTGTAKPDTAIMLKCVWADSQVN